MGGLAFKDPTIVTPRMPADIYQEIRARVLKILQQHFRYVAVPLEAPGKASYGDLDVLICEPLPGPGHNEISKPENLSVLLGARLWKRLSGSPTINFALPWPEPATSEVDNDPSATDSEDFKTFGTSPPHKPTPKPAGRFIQVDIHTCFTLQHFNWMLFNHAHGDMWNLVGSIIRRCSLLINDRALYILIPELARANANKNLTRVKITDEPKKVLEYLRLDWDKFWKPFESADEMMSYAASCRFHNPERGKKKVRGDVDPELDMGGVRTKANDRRRAAQRPVFQKWLEDYLPEHIDDPAGSASRFSKQEVVEDAKAFFGPDFAARYDAARRKGIIVVDSQRMWAEIRDKIKEAGAEGADLGYAMKGMKRCIQGEKMGEWVQEVVQQAAREAKEDSPSPDTTHILEATEDEPELYAADTGTLEDIGYEVAGLADVRRDFGELKYDLVKEWIMEDNKWKVIRDKQREKDERQSGELLRLKMEKEEERTRLEEQHEREKKAREERRRRVDAGEREDEMVEGRVMFGTAKERAEEAKKVYLHQQNY